MDIEGTAQTASLFSCAFDSPSRKAVSVMLRRSPIADNTESAIENVRATARETVGEPKDVCGIADHAFWAGNQLHVFKGGNGYVLVSVTGAGDHALEIARSVAKAALGHL